MPDKEAVVQKQTQPKQPKKGDKKEGFFSRVTALFKRKTRDKNYNDGKKEVSPNEQHMLKVPEKGGNKINIEYRGFEHKKNIKKDIPDELKKPHVKSQTTYETDYGEGLKEKVSYGGSVEYNRENKNFKGDLNYGVEKNTSVKRDDGHSVDTVQTIGGSGAADIDVAKKEGSLKGEVSGTKKVTDSYEEEGGKKVKDTTEEAALGGVMLSRGDGQTQAGLKGGFSKKVGHEENFKDGDKEFTVATEKEGALGGDVIYTKDKDGKTNIDYTLKGRIGGGKTETEKYKEGNKSIEKAKSVRGIVDGAYQKGGIFAVSGEASKSNKTVESYEEGDKEVTVVKESGLGGGATVSRTKNKNGEKVIDYRLSGSASGGKTVTEKYKEGDKSIEETKGTKRKVDAEYQKGGLFIVKGEASKSNKKVETYKEGDKEITVVNESGLGGNASVSRTKNENGEKVVDYKLSGTASGGKTVTEKYKEGDKSIEKTAGTNRKVEAEYQKGGVFTTKGEVSSNDKIVETQKQGKKEVTVITEKGSKIGADFSTKKDENGKIGTDYGANAGITRGRTVVENYKEGDKSIEQSQSVKGGANIEVRKGGTGKVGGNLEIENKRVEKYTKDNKEITVEKTFGENLGSDVVVSKGKNGRDVDLGIKRGIHGGKSTTVKYTTEDGKEVVETKKLQGSGELEARKSGTGSAKGSLEYTTGKTVTEEKDGRKVVTTDNFSAKGDALAGVVKDEEGKKKKAYKVGGNLAKKHSVSETYTDEEGKKIVETKTTEKGIGVQYDNEKGASAQGNFEVKKTKKREWEEDGHKFVSSDEKTFSANATKNKEGISGKAGFSQRKSSEEKYKDEEGRDITETRSSSREIAASTNKEGGKFSFAFGRERKKVAVSERVEETKDGKEEKIKTTETEDATKDTVSGELSKKGISISGSHSFTGEKVEEKRGEDTVITTKKGYGEVSASAGFDRDKETGKPVYRASASASYTAYSKGVETKLGKVDKKKMKKLDEELSKLEGERSTVEKDLSQKEAQIRRLSRQAEKLRAEGKVAEAAEVESQIAALAKEVDALKGRISEYNKQIVEKKQEKVLADNRSTFKADVSVGKAEAKADATAQISKDKIRVHGGGSAKVSIVEGNAYIETPGLRWRMFGEDVEIRVFAKISAGVLAEVNGEVDLNISRGSRFNAAFGGKLQGFAGAKAGVDLGAKFSWLRKSDYSEVIKSFAKSLPGRFDDWAIDRLPRDIWPQLSQMLIGSGKTDILVGSAGVEVSAGIGGEASFDIGLRGGKIRISGNLNGTIGIGAGGRTNLEIDAVDGVRFLGVVGMKGQTWVMKKIEAVGRWVQDCIQKLRKKIDDFMEAEKKKGGIRGFFARATDFVGDRILNLW